MKTKKAFDKLLQQLQQLDISSADDEKLIELIGKLGMNVQQAEFFPAADETRKKNQEQLSVFFCKIAAELRIRGYNLVDIRQVADETPEVIEDCLEDCPIENLLAMGDNFRKMAAKDDRFIKIAEMADEKLMSRSLGSC